MAEDSGYSMTVNAEVNGPDGGSMFNLSMTWTGLSYSNLVDLEEVVGRGLIDGPVSLGRAMIGGGAARVSSSRK